MKTTNPINEYYVICNRRTKKMVAGTDHKRGCQIYSDATHPPLLFPLDEELVQKKMKKRGMKPENFVLAKVRINPAFLVTKKEAAKSK